MRELVEVAHAAAHEVGMLLRSAYGQEKVIHFKGEVDLVTETDREAERLIVDRIRRAFPDHRIVAEEGSADELHTKIRDDEWVWYVDPLDGTTNFAHSYPHFAVSLGIARGRELQIGVVHDPMRNETFSAQHGAGAFLNDKPIRVSAAGALDRALIGTGFPYDRRERAHYYLAFVADVLSKSQGVRRGGTASLDLCYVASGRLDGFWEFKLKPWDIAAGALILRQAGGVVSDFSGEALDLYGDQILATNSLIHAEMVSVLKHRLERE